MTVMAFGCIFDVFYFYVFNAVIGPPYRRDDKTCFYSTSIIPPLMLCIAIYNYMAFYSDMISFNAPIFRNVLPF